MKTVNGTGVMDCTYNYYLNGQSVIEERNGSNLVIKQHIWGLGYVDEARGGVRTAINSDPTNTSHPPPQTCDQLYWLCQDANYNVLGAVDSTGTLQERYEYTAYGQRQVFYSAGSNDPGCYAPTMASTRVVTSGSVTQPYGLCEFGHQGLMHDEESGLVYNRARMLSPIIDRFMQEDPLGEPFTGFISKCKINSLKKEMQKRLQAQNSRSNLGNGCSSCHDKTMANSRVPMALLRYFDGLNVYNYEGNAPTDITDPSGFYRDCAKEEADCWANCWGTTPPGWVTPRRWDHYAYCTALCNGVYLECEAANAAEAVGKAVKYTFCKMSDAVQWVKDHPKEAVVGTVVVIGITTFIVATDGAGAVILIPAAP